MSTFSSTILRSAELIMLLGLGMPAVAAAATVPAGEATPLYLEVTLNHQETGQVLPFVLRDGRLFAPHSTLQELHFVDVEAGPPERALEDIPGVVVRYQASTQQLELEVPLAQLRLDTTVVNANERGRLQASSAPGVLLNYDLYANHGDASSNATAYAELRAFGLGTGVFSNSAVTRAYRTSSRGDDGWRGDTVRLDSRARWSFPDSMLSVTAGDTETGGILPWTRNVRVGGVRLGRNFALQPYRVVTPLPTFLGEVTVPSDVDLYINGMKQYSGELPVGPFQLSSLPNINGIGNAQMVITDAFGAVRSVELPFYATQALLASGMSDWSVTAGLVREDYGLQSFSYGNARVAAADLRYGANDALTLEGHAEGGDGLANVGGGAVLALGRGGVVSASHARSEWHSQTGSQNALAYSWNSTSFNVTLSSQRSRGEYRDIASAYGQGPATANDRILLGWSSPRLGSFSTSYLRLQYRGNPAQRYASIYWNRRMGTCCSLNLGINHNLDQSSDRTAYLGVSINLGDRRNFNGSVQRARGTSNVGVEVNQNRPGDVGTDWRARIGHDNGGTTGLAEAGWQAANLRLNGGIARMYDSSYGYAGASGSLVAMGGGLFAARSIPDAFAVVSTDGIAEVPVKLENRAVGTTNRKGLLLVTSLNAWQENRVAIDPMTLPPNTRLGEVEMIAVPTDRAGTLVRFPVTPVRSAVVVLHDANGAPIASGTGVQVVGQASSTFVGYDGEVYVELEGMGAELKVHTEGGTCSVRFDYPNLDVAMPRIGPLACDVAAGRKQRDGQPGERLP